MNLHRRPSKSRLIFQLAETRRYRNRYHRKLCKLQKKFARERRQRFNERDDLCRFIVQNMPGDTPVPANVARLLLHWQGPLGEPSIVNPNLYGILSKTDLYTALARPVEPDVLEHMRDTVGPW